MTELDESIDAIAIAVTNNLHLTWLKKCNLHAYSLSTVYDALYAITIRNWHPNNQRDSLNKRVALLLRKNPKIVQAIEQFKKPVLELKFSHKWLEGKHTVNDLAKEPYDSKFDNTGKEEDTQSKDVPTTTGTKFILSNIKQRIIDELNSNIEFNQRHVERMQAEANVVKKVVTPLTHQSRCNVIAIAFWALWFNRSSIYHEGAGKNAHGVISFIKAYITEIDRLENATSTMHFSVDKKWEPPVGDVLKLNFDASFQQDTNRSVSGVIVRNAKGLIMAACTHLNEYIMDSTMAVACAYLQSITFAEDLGFRKIIVEGDSLIVIKKMRTPVDDKSCISAPVKEVKARIRSFESINFSFAPRCANNAAHVLAEERQSHASSMYWVEEAPTSVERAAERDRWWLNSND
ncbi:hypothetical protein Goklo_007700 [Gossypium klotzschianum]|uniref:RNase H type-1 domain-containing protein n=1 Tax=Gossypium klotzschianum TaxID=34286 RepID=A0A7J8UY17_9ROSI|nr:hypothetical protein [Gossypium klotzschianum]